MRTVLRVIVPMIAFGFALPAASAAEIEFPARKPGQWEINIVAGAAARSMTIQLCLDEASDKAMMQAGMSMGAGMCTDMQQTRDGDTIVIDASCNVSGMKTRSHTVMSGDFQSTYKVVVTSDIENPPKGMPAQSTVTQDAKWVGECADGMTPGDMLMPGGQKMNVGSFMKSKGGG